jgi:hypothetical protein
MCKKQFNCPAYWKGIRVTKAVNLFCNLFLSIYIYDNNCQSEVVLRCGYTIRFPVRFPDESTPAVQVSWRVKSSHSLDFPFDFDTIFFLIYFTILTIVFSSNCRMEMESTPPDFPHSTFVFTRYDFCQKEQFDRKSYRVTTPLHRVQNSSVLIDKKSYLCSF